MKLLELSCDFTESRLLHPELVHPATGMPLAALVTKRGRVVWPILGGAPDPDDDDDSDSDDDDGDEDDDDDPDGDPDDEAKDKSKSKKPKEDEETPEQKRIKELTQDKIRFRRERNETRRELREFKEELDALKNKDAPELETVTKERDVAVKRAEVAEGTLREQAVALAFYSVNDITWKNPSDALELARRDLRDVDVDDGEADREAVAEVVQRLAKSKPYLLADGKEPDPKDKDPKSKNSQDGKGNPNDDSGSGGTGGRNKKKMSDEALRKKYQALRR